MSNPSNQPKPEPRFLFEDTEKITEWSRENLEGLREWYLWAIEELGRCRDLLREKSETIASQSLRIGQLSEENRKQEKLISAYKTLQESKRTLTVFPPGSLVFIGSPDFEIEARVLGVELGQYTTMYRVGYWDKHGVWITSVLPECEVSESGLLRIPPVVGGENAS